ncbi:hypothetical protein LSUB1_G006363 [Lachnellula subtilissima]|uniref:Uncharacterized protein n=1 Tax=Lachnellula subtilissima TaxID=602034 RepID=A0A8H8RMR3_9HELO|nr:hypothetical protein LSUB1_G006363 [Lachnellula subtilissima]
MTTERYTRFQPCYVLRDNDIPCVIWGEDAVGYYGVPTVVFTFYILVPDIDKAANILIQRGWHLEDNAQSQFGNHPLSSAHRRLMPPIDMTENIRIQPSRGPPPPPSKLPPGPTMTILLPATEWHFTFPSVLEGFFPPLPALLDALIDRLLDNDPLANENWSHLAILIAYLYSYVPALKEKSFAEYLKYEHRQYHYDSLSGMRTGTLPFVRHQRKVRDALRDGNHRLCDCSANQDDESLFTAKVEERLRALHASPCSPDEYEIEKLRQEEYERDYSD